MAGSDQSGDSSQLIPLGAADPWELPYPVEVIPVDPDNDAQWRTLQLELGRLENSADPPSTDRPLQRCFEVVRANRVRSIVVETRYMDLDYRSEFSTFYSRAFAKFLDSARRLHFFAEEVGADQVWNLSDIQKKNYLGYMVIRPQVKAAVGRTMLKPPKELKGSIRTAVQEDVTLLGQSLHVRAVPFMQQDARLGCCAHVALWMCHYSAHRADHRVARLPIAEFSTIANPGLGLGRSLPSTGLTLLQISDVLTQVGLPPLYYDLNDLNDKDRPDGDHWLRIRGDRDAQTTRVCCRYLNSGFPVLAVVSHVRGSETEKVDFDHGSLHAIVVCGYERVGEKVVLIAHDDRRGPYLKFSSSVDDYDDVWSERYKWLHVLAPLPEKVWLSGEAAERTGSEHLVRAAAVAVSEDNESAKVISNLFEEERLSFRTTALLGSTFKDRICSEIEDQVVRRAYREARFPRYVWVIEAIDRKARRGDGASADPQEAQHFGRPCVVGEVVLDATSDERDPFVLATRLPRSISIPRPDTAKNKLPHAFEGLTRSCGEYRP